MKKLFSLAAIIFVALLTATSVHAAPYIFIDARAEFDPSSDEMTVVMTFKNTGDKAANITGLSIFFINVYDGSGNLIFASKMMHTDDKYFPKFTLEPGQSAENVRLTFSNASGSYCGDMLVNPQNYSAYSYPVDWDWEVRYY